MQEQTNQINIKIVFVGRAGVGKTSLLIRQSLNQFTQKWVATIGVDFRLKNYKVGNINARAHLWDTAGQQRFRSLQKPYFKGANAILLCFDLSDSSSFQNLAKQLEEIGGLDTATCPVYLIGCKSDLQPKVFTDEILVFSQQHKCQYFQTSAKQSEGVNECFESIVKQCTFRKLEEMAFGKTESKKMEIKEQRNQPVKKLCC